MKTNLFLLVFLSCSLIVNAQLEKGKFLTDISGNFSRTFNANNSVTSSYSSRIKQFNTQINVGYCFSNTLAAGIGFNYGYSNTSTVNELIDYSSSLLMESKTDQKTKIPVLIGFLRYNKNVFSRLYIGVDFNVGYGKAHFSSIYAFASRSNFTTSGDIIAPGSGTNVNDGGTIEDENGMIIAGLSPRVTYFTGNHLGIFLNLGGAFADVTDGDFDQTQWNINFDPKYWSLGFEVKFK